MDSIIITGASGFIGKKLIKSLSSFFKVYAIVKDRNIDDKDNIVYINVNDVNTHQKLNEVDNIPIIVNLAWSGTYNNRDNLKIQLENITNLDFITNIALKYKIKYFYNFSSIMEYELINEFNNSLTSKNKYYGLAKFCEDYYLSSWCKDNNISYTSLVITNTFGVGENSTRLVNNIINNFIENKAIEFSSCNQLYSFIYIDDLIGIVSNLIKNKVTKEKYIIGDKNPKKLKEYIEKIYEILNNLEYKNVYPIFSNKSIISLSYAQLDATDSYIDSKYTNKYSLDDAIKLTFNYLKEIKYNK